MGKRRGGGAVAGASGSDRHAWRATEWGRLPGGAGVVGARPPGWPGPRGPKAGAQQPPILISPPLERASADGCVKNRTRVKIPVRFVCVFGVEVCDSSIRAVWRNGEVQPLFAPRSNGAATHLPRPPASLELSLRSRPSHVHSGRPAASARASPGIASTSTTFTTCAISSRRSTTATHAGRAPLTRQARVSRRSATTRSCMKTRSCLTSSRAS